MKEIVTAIRFGLKSVRSLSDAEIVILMDYYLPSDVSALCYAEIARRRDERLKVLEKD